MSCNTKTSLAAVIDAVNAQLNNNYVDRDDPRIYQGVFTEPTIRGGLMLDENAKLDFCGYVRECGLQAPFGKQWIDRPLYPDTMLVSYDDAGEITTRWELVADVLEQQELVDEKVLVPARYAGMVDRYQSGLNDERVSLLSFIPTTLHAGIKAYSYMDSVETYMQKAVDYCVANNKELYCPAGGYLLDPTTNVNCAVFLATVLGADKNLNIVGAGIGQTVFKEAPGATTSGGRYTKMFYFFYGALGVVADFGNVTMSGMTLDKNGRSNTNPLSEAKIAAGQPITNVELYHYEQAHILGFAGSAEMNIASVTLKDIELIDKVGGGLNFSSSPKVKIRKVVTENITSRYHPRVTTNDAMGDKTFGQRGCLEFGTSIDLVDINYCDILYAQIEPVIPSSKDMQRSYNVNGGSIGSFEFTDKGGYSFANLVNVKVSEAYTSFGMNINATGCTLRLGYGIAEGISKISSSTIYLPYDSDTNTVTSLGIGTPSGYRGYGTLDLTDVDVLIDSSDPDIRPTNALMGLGTGDRNSRKTTLHNVRLDKRATKGVNAYGTGDWHIESCDIYATVVHVLVGGVDIEG